MLPTRCQTSCPYNPLCHSLPAGSLHRPALGWRCPPQPTRRTSRSPQPSWAGTSPQPRPHFELKGYRGQFLSPSALAREEATVFLPFCPASTAQPTGPGAAPNTALLSCHRAHRAPAQVIALLPARSLRMRTNTTVRATPRWPPLAPRESVGRRCRGNFVLGEPLSSCGRWPMSERD